MVFNLMTDGLPKGTYVSQSYSHKSEVVKSASYVETGEDSGAWGA